MGRTMFLLGYKYPGWISEDLPRFLNLFLHALPRRGSSGEKMGPDDRLGKRAYLSPRIADSRLNLELLEDLREGFI